MTLGDDQIPLGKGDSQLQPLPRTRRDKQALYPEGRASLARIYRGGSEITKWGEIFTEPPFPRVGRHGIEGSNPSSPILHNPRGQNVNSGQGRVALATIDAISPAAVV